MKRYEYTSKTLSFGGDEILTMNTNNWVEVILGLKKFNTLVSQMDDEGWEFMSVDTLPKEFSIHVSLVFRKPYKPVVGTELEIQLKGQGGCV